MADVQRRVNDDDALSVFTGPVRGWFEESFAEPTEAQQQGWPAIAAGDHTLILAPTGSGKTLAAFLWALDRLTAEPTPATKARCRVLYVSPLKALAVDVDRNLRAPLAGIRRVAARAGADVTEVDVGIRTGDTTAQERRRLQRVPPDVLITTPESLYLMLTSQAREALRSVRTVIVDEIHAVAGTKRGAHLALSLERLEELTNMPPQRIGLSATQRPLDEIAHFLGGQTSDGPRPVTIVDTGARKPLELEVIVPVEDMGALGEVLDEAPVVPWSPSQAPARAATVGEAAASRGPAAAAPPRASIWPHVHPRLLDLIEAHRSTIVFVNSRRLAERLAARLNELAEERAGVVAPDEVVASGGANSSPASTPRPEGRGDLVRAHHGSLAREQRTQIEDDLKAGRLRAIVATSSLELGIDMGAVDLVVQVESPGSVARGLQRVGRAGHQVDAPSRGKIFPKYRGDLLEAAVVAQRMRAGLVEETRYPRNPLDVLAQQIVAACALDEWDVDELRALMRRAANYGDLSDDVFESVLDLLAGRFPSDEFAGLKPRIVWDRIGGRVRGRDGAQRLAVTNAGTIPDRGLFGVFLPEGTRVGELDEEMVYESRPGETFVLGASTWRIEQITHDRVVVSPAPGEPAKTPFWKGDKPGRPLELGRALGAFVREVGAAPHDDAVARLHDEMGLDDLAAENLVRYLEEQREATGALPDDRTIIAERFPDEIGDWRVCVLSPFGSRVHAPWALALEARLAERFGLDVQVLWSDDGIVLRLPEAVESIPVEELLLDPDEVEELVVAQLPSTAMFASRFREASARALLLPRRRPDQRTPLWQQRQRAADLLEVASRYETFPLLLETTRECLRDVFDLSALREVLRDLRSRKVRVVPAETGRASPFAQSLLFGWIAVYMYEGDAPLAERRAAALALDRDLLRDLLGSEELRELLDAGVVAELELELQRLGPSARPARSADEVHDLLRELGDLSDDEIAARTEGDATTYVDTLVGERRAFRLRVAGEARVAAAEDAARFRDALGAAAPAGLPGAFTEPVPAPLDDLLARYARTHAPFTTADAAARLGVPVDDARAGLTRLAAAERAARGEFRPGGVEREWCDANVLRRLRRRSLAALRHEVEPVDADALARFLPQWQGVGGPGHGPDAVADALGPLQGVSIPASVLEADVLPARVPGYREAALDELCTAGELVWIGAGPLGADDGKVALYFRHQVPLLAQVVNDSPPEGPVHDALRAHLAAAGASFWPELVRAAGTADDRVVLTALWDLVWAGEVTNDTLAPLRALGARRSRSGGRGRPRPGRITRVGPPAGAGRWSLVAPLLEPAPAPTAAAVARAQQLLERHGVLTREAARAEGVPGGYAAVYPTLRAMEESGKVRRGYFVAGLGAAQFALPGAVDRLRARPTHDEPDILVLAATDPAQAYGAALPWPATEGGKPARAAGAHVVLHDGAPVAFLDRGGHNLTTFPGADGNPETWLDAVAGLVKHGRRRQIEIQRVDGEAVRDAALADPLRAAAFQDTYRGLVLRP